MRRLEVSVLGAPLPSSVGGPPDLLLQYLLFSNAIGSVMVEVSEFPEMFLKDPLTSRCQSEPKSCEVFEDETPAVVGAAFILHGPRACRTAPPEALLCSRSEVKPESCFCADRHPHQ